MSLAECRQPQAEVAPTGARDGSAQMCCVGDDVCAVVALDTGRDHSRTIQMENWKFRSKFLNVAFLRLLGQFQMSCGYIAKSRVIPMHSFNSSYYCWVAIKGPVM